MAKLSGNHKNIASLESFILNFDLVVRRTEN